MNIQLSQRDKAILEELAIAVYHDTQGFHDLFGIKNTGRTWLSDRLKQLTDAGYLGRTKYPDNSFLGSYVYYLAKKGIDALALDDAVAERLYNHTKATKSLKGQKLRHDVLRSRFRLVLLKSGKMTNWSQEQQGFPIKGEFTHDELGRITARVIPDALFTLNNNRHYFLEVDMVSEDVRASTVKRIAKVEKKFRLYESLLEDRWRLDPLGISYFNLLWLKRTSYSPNPNLNGMRFTTIHRMLAEADFPNIRKATLFLDEAELGTTGQIFVEDHAGKRQPLAA